MYPKEGIKISLLLLLLVGLFIPQTLLAAATKATSNGNWNSAATWNNGVPQCGDTIIIDSNVQVTITAHVNLDEDYGCSIPIHIEVYGRLQFNTGRKLYLPCNSFVSISGAGQLIKGNGGGNSNIIDICQTTVWNAGTGSQNGPTSYGSGAALPITLIRFDAVFNNNVVELEWVTASEINNDFFTVERSADALTFETLFTKDGAGNSTSRRWYTATDDNPIPSTTYYRLKQTDFNGDYSYSDIVAVNTGTFNQHIQLAPNPAKNVFRVSGREGMHTPAFVEIYDMNMRPVLRQLDGLQSIDISTLYPGLYLVRVYRNDNYFIGQQKLIIH